MRDDISKTELKERLGYIGYSCKFHEGRVEVYPKRRRKKAVFAPTRWDALVKAKATARIAFENLINPAPAWVKVALVAWYEDHGADWAQDLRIAWYDGNYKGSKHAGMLQRFRNTTGREFLNIINK